MKVGKPIALDYQIEGPEDTPVLVLSNSLGTTILDHLLCAEREEA